MGRNQPSPLSFLFFLGLSLYSCLALLSSSLLNLLSLHIGRATFAARCSFWRLAGRQANAQQAGLQRALAGSVLFDGTLGLASSYPLSLVVDLVGLVVVVVDLEFDLLAMLV